MSRDRCGGFSRSQFLDENWVVGLAIRRDGCGGRWPRHFCGEAGEGQHRALITLFTMANDAFGAAAMLFQVSQDVRL